MAVAECAAACGTLLSGDDDPPPFDQEAGVDAVDAADARPRVRPLCADPKPPTTVGLFDPKNGQFDLFGENTPAPPRYSFLLTGATGKRPVAGHWLGPADDTVGWHDPASAQFFLADKNATSAVAKAVSLGVMGDAFPIAGDWNGDGATGIALFAPDSGTFFLKDVPGYGLADLTFQVKLSGRSMWPIAGDWDGCGVVHVGLYDTANAIFYLFRSNASFAEFDEIPMGEFAKGDLLPIAGRWAVP